MDTQYLNEAFPLQVGILNQSVRGGFSFCGKLIADFGLSYAPLLTDTYIYGTSKYKVHEQVFDAHDGGYFYGTTLQPKLFKLRCYFTLMNVNEGVLDKIYGFFYNGRTGKLVFDKRDYLYYNATITNIEHKLTNYMNGFVTFTMKAYYPFARSDYMYLPLEYKDFKVLWEDTGIVLQDMVPDTTIVVERIGYETYLSNNMPQLYTPLQLRLCYQLWIKTTPNNPLTELTSFLLYNPGTARADVAILIAGDVGDGVLIINNTTGQTCKFVALSRDITTYDNKYLICDSMNGKTILTNGKEGQLNFLYHDNGFIQLAPSYPVSRNVPIHLLPTVSQILSPDAFDLSDEGRYIYLENGWRKIVKYINKDYVITDYSQLKDKNEFGTIATLNEITVRPLGKMCLDKLNFIYKPTFA